MVAPMPRASESTAVAVNDGAAEERSGGEAEIVEEIAEPAGEPDVADFLAHLGEAASSSGGAAAGFALREAGAR